MGTIYRKTVTRPLPAGSTIITRKDVRLAQWTSRSGKTKTAELNEAGNRIRCETGTYLAKYRDGDGIVCEVSTGCRDKQAALAVLNDLLAVAERIKSKVMTSAEAKIGEKHADTLLIKHIEAYEGYLKSRKVDANWIKTTKTYMQSSIDGCDWRYLRDLSADSLSRWLAEQVDNGMSHRVHNVYVQSWVAFGNWCIGKRVSGKSTRTNGEKRLLNNPFQGVGKLNEKADLKRKARSLTSEELERLLSAARNRPLDDALTIRKGPNKGERTAKIDDAYRVRMIELGNERALMYKTLILTGLRLSELRTLTVGDLSFGDVPFLRLQSNNEKNRKGSTLAIRSDLAAELREWTNGNDRASTVFVVPAGLLRIMDRDLIAAKIPKRDADGFVVHVHALRHSFGTHLSLAGIAPRTAQAMMRHSRIELTMNTYTDSRLLDTAAAVESIGLFRTVAPNVALDPDDCGQFESIADHSEDLPQNDGETRKPSNPLGMPGFFEVENTGLEPATSCMPCKRSPN